MRNCLTCIEINPIMLPSKWIFFEGHNTGLVWSNNESTAQWPLALWQYMVWLLDCNGTSPMLHMQTWSNINAIYDLRLQRLLNTVHCYKATHIMYILHRYLLFLQNTLTLWKWTLVRSMRCLDKLMLSCLHLDVELAIQREKIPINSLVNWKHFYIQMIFQHSMFTLYCMGKLWAAIVYCIWNCGSVGFYIVFVTVREQSGDVCIVPETCHSTA